MKILCEHLPALKPHDAHFPLEDARLGVIDGDLDLVFVVDNVLFFGQLISSQTSASLCEVASHGYLLQAKNQKKLSWLHETYLLGDF